MNNLEKGKKITENKNEIIKLYNSGLSCASIGQKFGVSRECIAKILSKNNIQKRGNSKSRTGRITDSQKRFNENINLVLDMLENGFKLKETAKKINISYDSIKKYIRKYEIKFYRNRGSSVINDNKYEYDCNFFEKIDTQEKAYILGLIYADGCVASERSACSISLKEDDKYLLEQISQIFYGCKNVIKRSKRSKNHNLAIKNNKIYQDLFTFIIYDKKIKNDLIKLGCKPRKTYHCEFPTEIPDHLIRHFIRGFFDGDGSVYKAQRSENNIKLRVDFIGTIDFLYGIKNQLLKKVNIATSFKKGPSSFYGSQTFCKTIDVYNFYNFLYSDATIFLKRKKEVFDSFFRYIKNKDGTRKPMKQLVNDIKIINI